MAAAAITVSVSKPDDTTLNGLTASEIASLIAAFDLFVPQPLPPVVKPTVADAKDAKESAAPPPLASVKPATNTSDPKAVAAWIITRANPIETQFFAASYKRLNGLLARLLPTPLSFTIDNANHSIGIVNKSDPTKPVLNGDVTKLLNEWNAFLRLPGKFNFPDVVGRVTKATMGHVVEWLTQSSSPAAPDDVVKALDPKVLSAIEPVPIAFNGGEMASYEIDFQAGYRVLTYPDVNQFTADHLALLNSAKKERPYLSYSYDALCFPEHELQHCIQMELKQKDDKGWALEHDASRIAYVLTALIAQREQQQQQTAAAADAKQQQQQTPPLFPPGKMEEIALYTLKLVAHTTRSDPSYTAAYESGYKSWRDSYGVTSPVPGVDSFTFVTQNQNVTDAFKYRVSLEAYYQARMTGGNYLGVTQQLLSTNYSARINTDITKAASGGVVIPKELVISDAYGLNAMIDARMTNDQAAAYLKAL